ncbi:MAG: glycosyltransferase family 9 protein, partial [Chlamydiia bacterium]
QTFFEDTSVFQPKGVSLVLPEIERVRLESMAPINPSTTQPIFMVALGSQWQNKQLSDETAVKLLHHIHSVYQARFIFIYYGLQEKIRVSRLAESFLDAATIIGDVSLEFLQAFMQKSDGVICADSAVLHLAASAGVPTFTVFGPSSARVYKPLGALHIAVQGTCPYNKTFVKRCSRLRSCETGACIKEVDLSVVFASFNHFYSSLLALKGCQNRYES